MSERACARACMCVSRLEGGLGGGGLMFGDKFVYFNTVGFEID